MLQREISVEPHQRARSGFPPHTHTFFSLLSPPYFIDSVQPRLSLRLSPLFIYLFPADYKLLDCCGLVVHLPLGLSAVRRFDLSGQAKYIFVNFPASAERQSAKGGQLRTSAKRQSAKGGHFRVSAKRQSARGGHCRASAKRQSAKGVYFRASAKRQSAKGGHLRASAKRQSLPRDRERRPENPSQSAVATKRFPILTRRPPHTLSTR